ncbi:MAG: NUDIX domain-containing protein [Patescibacteria group bacterium]
MIHENTYKKVYFNGSKELVFIGDKSRGREGDESPFAAFKREVKEEFGINLEREDIHFSCTIPSVIEPGEKSYFLVTRPLQINEINIVFGNEGTEWMLMTPEEFITRPDGIKRQQDRVEKYLSDKLVSG